MSEIFCRTIQISNESLDEFSKNELDIKLFNIKLSIYYHLVPRLIKYLNAAELQRAQKYHFEKDTNRFIICRTLLKFILAQHINLDILEIHIEIDENKKPYLSSHESIFFNVSHAEDCAFIAISNAAVGVDVEYLNKKFDFTDILKYTFSDQESDIILKSNNKVEAFYKFWTRKEAIVKAIGKGIDDDLIKIPVTEGLHSVSQSIVGNYKKLSVFSFNLNDDYVGALALTEDIPNFDRIVFHPIPFPEKLMSLIP